MVPCNGLLTMTQVTGPAFDIVMAEDEARGRMPPIKVKFEVPYFTVSGIQVRYLKVVERTGYQALPWVRYITTGGTSMLYVGGVCTILRFKCAASRF